MIGRLIAVLCIIPALPQVAFGQSYTFLRITIPPDSLCTLFEGVPTGINNRQQIVGYTRPVCDECCSPGNKRFLWDPIDGLRFLDVSGGPAGIDDAGTIWLNSWMGPSGYRVSKWVDGVVSELPLPPGAGSAYIWKVWRSGIVAMRAEQADGRQTLWTFDNGSFRELVAPTDVRIFTLNEQGALGGCRLLDSQGRDGRAYLQLPDGRAIEPWPIPCQTFFNTGGEGVTLLSAAGHFAGWGAVDRAPAFGRDFHGYYGTPDGRLWGTGASIGAPSLIDMNSNGTLLGSRTQRSSYFTFREGAFTDLTATMNGPSVAGCGFSPGLINDRGAIAGNCAGGIGVLVPSALPPPPASLAFGITGRIVTLTWGASPGAVEYSIEVGSAPGLTDLYSASLGAALSLTTAAPPGRFYVRIRARAASGTSGPSNEAVIDVP